MQGIKIMGTFLKYLAYLLVIVVLYIIIRGFFDGSINSSTTVGGVAEQVNDGTRAMVSDAADAVSEAVDDARQAHQHQ